jgi:uncharacterized protein YdeI (YjbR/CyaY-like superfamily)
MSNSNTNPKVDFYFNKESRWQKEMGLLRKIVLSCGPVEELKWGCPCYTINKGNVLIIHKFKEYCAILFIKGALLNDANGLLIQQTENVQAGRQIRFANLQEIIELETTLKTYIHEAIEVEKAGLKVELKKTSDYKIPEEFQLKLSNIPELKTAFESLTPGRQRAYIYFFSQAKQSKTREQRVEKYLQHILNGKGLDD